MEKIANISGKNILTYYNFWEDVPADFSDCGGRVPRPPAFDAHDGQ